MHRRQSGIHQLFFTFLPLFKTYTGRLIIRRCAKSVSHGPNPPRVVFFGTEGPLSSQGHANKPETETAPPLPFFSFNAPVNPPLQTRQFSPTHFRKPQNIHFGGDRENVSFRLCLLQIIMLSRLSKTKQREFPNKPRN